MTLVLNHFCKEMNWNDLRSTCKRRNNNNKKLIYLTFSALFFILIEYLQCPRLFAIFRLNLLFNCVALISMCNKQGNKSNNIFNIREHCLLDERYLEPIINNLYIKKKDRLRFITKVYFSAFENHWIKL